VAQITLANKRRKVKWDYNLGIVRKQILWSFLFFLFASALCQAGNSHDLLIVVQNGKYGYIDDEGKVIIRPQFIWAGDFFRGLGIVYVCGRYVSIDSSGALHPLQVPTQGPWIARKQGEKFGFVDAAGEFKIQPIYDDVQDFSGGLAAVKVGEKWGFIDTSGRMAIEPQFKEAYFFREGVATADNDSGEVLIDKSGKVLAQGYTFPNLINDGRVPVFQEDFKWGYLDLTGKIAIPLIFDTAMEFSDGLAAVQINKKWGYVDRDGKIVIPLHFDFAGPFANGLAPVKLGDKSGFIDKTGKFAFLLAFDQAWGFLKEDDESALDIAPAHATGFGTADGKFGYVNLAGRVIWGPVEEHPEHRPLLGWSDEDKKRSCEGIPATMKKAVASFPAH
jgi:hypothetical protein